MSTTPTEPCTLLLHVGYPKTGSTWLQRGLFAHEENGFATPWGLPTAEAIEQFVLPNPYRYDPSTARAAFASGVAGATSRRLVPVLSNEILIGDQMKGRYWGRTVMERMHAAQPEARVLMVIREQHALALSSYREHIKQGGTQTIESFIGIGQHEAGFAPTCRADFLEYDLAIEHCQTLFGREQVLVMPYELLRADAKAFAQRIQTFAGIDDRRLQIDAERFNVGFGAGTLAFRRRLNRFAGRASFGRSGPPLSWRIARKASIVVDCMLPKRAHERAELALRDTIRKAFDGKFTSSNARTASLTGLDLRTLGYAC